MLHNFSLVNFVFLYNSGEPCTPLAVNGYVQCTGPQVTDENCTFSCDPGYNLTGSELRTCQSDHTWSGENAVCSPLHCVELTAPENAFVKMPCTTEYTSSCKLVCEDGFHVESYLNTFEWMQSCVLTDKGNVTWTEAQICIGMFCK